MSESVESLLDDIHAALLTGRFAELASLTEALEIGAEALSSNNTSMTAAVRTKALRNEKCLIAALRGLRSAHSRVEEITKATQGLTTYSVNGCLSVLSVKPKPGRRF